MSQKQPRAQKPNRAAAGTTGVSPADAGPASRRRLMLVGLVAVSAALIAFGVVNSRTAATGTPAAATAAQGAVAAPAAAAPSTARALASLQPVFDFGAISMAAGTVRHTYAVANTGPDPVAITGVQTSCMCTAATVVNEGRRTGPFGMPGHGRMPTIRETVAPGAMVQVEVTFDPAAHGPAGIGRTERVVTIETDRGAPLQLGLVAMVRP